MSRYSDFMSQLTNGKGCDDCPLYHNDSCNDILDKSNESLDCGEVLFRYLNEDDE